MLAPENVQAMLSRGLGALKMVERVFAGKHGPRRVKSCGKRIVTASEDKRARVWDVFPDTQALISAAKALRNRTNPLIRWPEHQGRAALDELKNKKRTSGGWTIASASPFTLSLWFASPAASVRAAAHIGWRGSPQNTVPRLLWAT
jgi:hypothetical protein